MTTVAQTSGTAALFRKDEHLEAARAQVADFERQARDTSALLEMARSDRLERVNPALFDACWERATAKHKTLGVVTAIGFLTAGAVAGAALSLSGAPQLAGLVALGSLIGTFKGVPHLYAAVVKKWILPRQVDALVVPRLEQQKASLESAAGAARSQLKLEEARAAVAIQEAMKRPPEALPQITVEQATVEIDGVKLPILG